MAGYGRLIRVGGIGAIVMGLLVAGCGRSASDLTRVPPPVIPLAEPAVQRAPLPPPPLFFAARTRPEIPYTRSDLLRNFLSIALRAEAADDVGADGNIAISKWNGLIRYRLSNAQPRDRLQIAVMAQRLSQLTNLDIREAGEVERHHMDIRFIPRSQRAAEVGQLLATGWLGPAVSGLARSWRDREEERCFTLTTRDPGTGITKTAHILIKDELPLLWRETCIIEEITQSLGLLNDDPRAAPSIFNDDGMYEALTTHDELLLQVLYDPRIRPGMRRDMVVPLAEQVIADLTVGGRT